MSSVTKTKSRVTLNIIIPLADIRAKADAKSERLNQALWGMRVKPVGKPVKDFIKVILPDKYSGYAQLNHLGVLQFRSKEQARIISSFVPVFDSPDEESDIILRLHFNTEVFLLNEIDGWGEIDLGNGLSGFIPEGFYIPVDIIKPGNFHVSDLIYKAGSFIGTPYLWGGITPSGWDCSGFIQAVFKHFGIKFPRDTKDQVKIGRRIKYINHLPGDLAFFKRHVGMFIERDTIIHSSEYHGGVAIDKIGENMADFGARLFAEKKEVRRIFRGGK